MPITTDTPLTDGTVSLGPLRRDLVDTYLRWTNDPVVMRGNGRAEPETCDNLADGTDVRLAGDNLHFTVYDTTRTADDGGPLPVGTTSLSIDDYVGTAEFFIALGEEGRSRGLAARATRLTLQAAFDHGLRSVHLAVLEPNTAAIRAYTRAGFQRIGVRRACGWWEGEVCGEVLMDAVPGDLAGSTPFPAAAVQPR
ncbi:GNAT family N-acetyltransferase [Yinghuangia aomiensis]